MNNLARGGIIGRFQAQEWVSARDERRPICLACWKSLKFAKYFEILGKQMHLGYCPGLCTYSANFSTLYLFLAIYMNFRRKFKFSLPVNTLGSVSK